jgi:ribonucleotide monophosphatase NagD (HAD superfamily)
MLGTARERTLAVGDSLRTDIAGAAGLGIDALWMLSGIHAVSPAEARAHATAAGLAPKAILPDLHW